MSKYFLFQILDIIQHLIFLRQFRPIINIQADNLLLFGPSDVGKSHIAAALAYHLIEKGILSKWLPATALVQQLQQAKKELDLMKFMT